MRRSAGRRRDRQLCRGLCGPGGGSAEAHKQRGAHGERHQRDGKDDHHKAGGSAGHCAGVFAGFKAEQREQQKKNAAARQAGKTGDKADACEERGLAAHAIAGRVVLDEHGIHHIQVGGHARDAHTHQYAGKARGQQAVHKVHRHQRKSQPRQRDAPAFKRAQPVDKAVPEVHRGDGADEHGRGEKCGVAVRQLQRVLDVERNARQQQPAGGLVEKVGDGHKPEIGVGGQSFQRSQQAGLFALAEFTALPAPQYGIKDERAAEQPQRQRRGAVTDGRSDHGHQRNADDHAHQLHGLPQGIRLVAALFIAVQLGQQGVVVHGGDGVARLCQHQKYREIYGQPHARAQGCGRAEKQDGRKHEHRHAHQQPGFAPSPAGACAVRQITRDGVVESVPNRIQHIAQRDQLHGKADGLGVKKGAVSNVHVSCDGQTEHRQRIAPGAVAGLVLFHILASFDRIQMRAASTKQCACSGERTFSPSPSAKFLPAASSFPFMPK